MIKHRHHHVWQHYLKAWEGDDERIGCIIRGQVRRVNTINLAVIHDFYRLKELTSSDLIWVRALCIEALPPEARKVQEGWVRFFTAIFDLRKQFEELVTGDPAVALAFDEAINNLEEDLHSDIEGKAIPHLDAARSGDLGFLMNDDELTTFVHFLAVQSMRTANMRMTILAAMKRNPLPGLVPENAWGLLSHIFATNIGASLYAGRGGMRSTVLEAPPGAELITSDQPVINMRGSISRGAPSPALRHDDFELYYPLSPTAALLVEVGQPKREVGRRRLTPEECARYNAAMFALAHEQAFAANESLLRDLSGAPA
jgi:hypothetical protein